MTKETSSEASTAAVKPTREKAQPERLEDNSDQEEVAQAEEMPMNTQNDEQHKPELAPDAFFIMKRTPCFGRCPVYNLEIKQNGVAYLEGIQFFDFEGMRVAKMTETQLDQIRALADKYGYFEMEHVYDAPVTDLPSVTTAMYTRNGTQWVYNRMEAPEALNQFQLEVETLIKDLQWSPVE